MCPVSLVLARPDHDLHVLIEGGEKLHQAFDGRADSLE